MPLGALLTVSLPSAALASAALFSSGEPAGEAGAPESAFVLADWIPVVDPELRELPAAVRGLDFSERRVYQSRTGPRVLVVRRHLEEEYLVDAFMADEEKMMSWGEFVPVGDMQFDIDGREVFASDCEWTLDDAASRVSALYTYDDEDTVLSLWLVDSALTEFDPLRDEVEAAVSVFAATIEPPQEGDFEAVLLKHVIGFGAHVAGGPPSGDSAGGLHFVPAEPRPGDTSFFDAVTGVNPQFEAATLGRWLDPERDVSLTLQVFMTDTGLGPKEPFVDWVASQVQVWRRVDRDKGDAPIEIIHVPTTTTSVISDAEVARHYANNERAPEAGVILQTYLPKTPFCRAARLRWSGPVEEPEEEPAEGSEGEAAETPGASADSEGEPTSDSEAPESSDETTA